MLKKRSLHLSSPSLRGFTLIEVLIVVSILALLMLALLASFTKQRIKAEDARIKADLEQLRVAFEEYYSDNNCYPPAEWFNSADDCGSENLKPYLISIPCNPKTAMPYVLEIPDPPCSAFKLYADLANLYDPALLQFCVDSDGSTDGNYGVSSTNTTITTDCTGLPSPPPTPTSTPESGRYGCQDGHCNDYHDSINASNMCDDTFSDYDLCLGLCPTHPELDCHE